MTVRTDNVALLDLGEHEGPRLTLVDHHRDVPELLAPDVVEVHADRREPTATIGTGNAFQLIQFGIALGENDCTPIEPLGEFDLTIAVIGVPGGLPGARLATAMKSV
jgi:hypothetical protein